MERSASQRGIRLVQAGMLLNAGLAAIKLVAGVAGSTYALVADGVESSADILASFILWRGLDIADREPDEDYPFGYGKAEALSAAVVCLMLIAAAVGIAIEAVREIRTPHHTPAAWTLLVLVLVVVTKTVLSRRARATGKGLGSTAVQADASHHLSDAVTSGAAFVGISIAVLGSRYRGGSGWESADDWAALLASAVIAYNGFHMLRPALHDLMDRGAASGLVEAVRAAARRVPDVEAIEKLAVRKAGMTYQVVIHVQAAPGMPLAQAHALGGRVKAAIRAAVPEARWVVVHMEPYEEPAAGIG